MGLTNCPKCGETISEKATVCPRCNSAVKQKQKKHKGAIISIIVFALIVVSVLGIGISQKAKELKYYSNMVLNRKLYPSDDCKLYYLI